MGELLRAEERAHDAEGKLKDTKEQLLAATESPFVASSKKSKNEMKKQKGGKSEKLDSLQQSLEEVTNRLSASEETLNDVQNQRDAKDGEIQLLHKKITDLEQQVADTERVCAEEKVQSARKCDGLNEMLK